MGTESVLVSPEYEKEMGYYDTEIGREDLKQRKAEAFKKLRDTKLKKAKTSLKSKKKVLKKIIKKKKKKLKKLRFEQAMRGRAKLLRELIRKRKRPVAIMREIEDKIPPAFSEEHSIFGDKPRKPRPTFLEKGGFI